MLSIHSPCLFYHIKFIIMNKFLHVVFLFFLFQFCNWPSLKVLAQGNNRVDVGKSYANISKLSTGGTYNPGDTVEVRVTIAVIRQSTVTVIDDVRIFDNIPANTSFINGSMRVATNEGITYKGPFTNALDADWGTRTGSSININLGAGANGSTGGRIRSDSRPSFYNSHCIMMACYKVRINPTANYGDTIKFGGSISYRVTTPNTGAVTISFPEYQILLFPYNGYCPNGSDVSAASDAGGTFGDGTAPNRVAPLGFSTTYIKQNISTGQPQDYNYAIVKNSSADSWTNPYSPMPEGPSLHRVFGLWDIAGDHTGATNLSAGNAPPAATTRAGYFVLINASYNTNVAYQETLSNLCPNTYYEFSAWYRNVCPRCSCDSTGRGSSASGFIPGPGNDSSGVKPNLNFEVDGLAYYTTGDIKYDRGVPWKKFGFTFRTRPGQTTANFAIRNNSPGGGGNDWAIDDIKVAHCGPQLDMNYTPEVLGCREGPFPVILKDTIRFIYNSYVHFKWQKSNVGGTVWTDMVGPGTSGIGSPTLINGLYQYVTTLPTFWATYADSGTYYRVIVATTASNLSDPNCAYKNESSTMVRVVTCGEILRANFTHFSGRLNNQTATLQWNTKDETGVASYILERSSDGVNFIPIGNVAAKNTLNAQYFYADALPGAGNYYYRLKMMVGENLYKYSEIIQLDVSTEFAILQVENPFKNAIQVSFTTPEAGTLTLNLLSDKGQKIESYTINIKKGVHTINWQQEKLISKGMYYLRAEFNGKAVTKKLVKY